MPRISEIKKYVTDHIAQDIIDTASAGGITYWATEPTDEEFAGLPAGKKWTIVEGVDDTGWGGVREVDEVHYLDADQIREAYADLLALDQDHVNRQIHGYIVESWLERDEKNGIDTSHIDADAADAIVQLAALGEIRYG
ncbi:hypothetical protein P1P75_01195 [Streptomyces sp. ID05-39B]|uniref:hypothetical protein n=1 Tax=Streptomyces sp. ID05-39B TaxID=3028664 RepID=UPI0029AD4A99|nr:hypothetical protein [Streptomyces sp. ID05-39B]MDX3525098.1 hypothetical protein [Streptomyces sp. ID05-39B]